jgi:hypothetical membrane protein
MKKENEFEPENMLKHSSTAVFSLIPIIIGILFIFYALSQFPGYSMIKNYVSHLGIGPKPSAQFFNVGVIIIGAASIHFFIYLGKLLKASGIDEIIRKITVKISIIGGLCLALVGAFPMFDFLEIFHMIVASTFFFSGMLYFLLFSYLMIRNPNFSKYQSFPGFVVGLIFAGYVFTAHPIFEWGVVFSGFFWVIFNGVWLGVKNVRMFLVM